MNTKPTTQTETVSIDTAVLEDVTGGCKHCCHNNQTVVNNFYGRPRPPWAYGGGHGSVTTSVSSYG